MKRFLREPLLHFVLIGILLFAADAFLRQRTVRASGGDILVSQGRIESLAALFAKTWQRLPTPEELGGLVDDYVLEEVLYREGLAMGVDQDDTIIRRRVRQKMEFVVQDVVALAEPTEAELEAWLAENGSDYARPARYRFRQIYLNPERRGDSIEEEAGLVLAELRSLDEAADPRELGDPSLLEHAFPDARADVVEGTFGRSFADALADLPTGVWSGPVESVFGLHLVLVDERTEGQLPALADVREAVARDWSYAQSGEASERFNAKLLERYRVTIEWPQMESGDPDDLKAGPGEGRD